MVCLHVSGVETESLMTVIQIGAVVSECCLGHGRRRPGVSPGSKCGALLTMIAVSDVTRSEILKPIGAELLIVNVGAMMKMLGWSSVCLMMIL